MIKKVKLGDLVEFQRGYDLPKNSAKGGRYPVVTSNGIMTYHDEYRSSKSVVIGRSGTIGNPQLIEHDFWPHNTTLYVKDFKNNNIEYIYYLLLNMDIGKMKSGSNIPTLNRNHLHPLEILAEMDIEKQKNLVGVLKAIDSKIENNNKINVELESMAKTIYDYWFLQFEFPNKDGKPYKSSGGKMVWNEELKRAIPAGWKQGTFFDLIEIGNGKDHKELHNGKVPVYGSGGVMRFVDKAIYDGESVLIPRKGTLNNIIYVNGAFWAVDTMFYSKMKMEHTAIFTYYSVRLHDFEKLNTGTGVPSMTSSIIYDLKTVIPTRQILKDFDLAVQSFYKQIQANRKENTELASLRDFLLPLLLNGQVSFKV